MKGCEIMDYKQVIAIKEKNKKIIKQVCPNANDRSGIYFMTREENGFKYAYVGQAKHILTRLAEHLTGYQHIDISLKKHKFYGLDNPTGWKVNCLFFPLDELDEKEQYYIKLYANNGYQMRNKTAGGQGEGKFNIAESKPVKGYRDGIESGYNKARKEVSKLFEKNLTYSINGTPNKNKEKAYEKFAEFLLSGNYLNRKPIKEDVKFIQASQTIEKKLIDEFMEHALKGENNGKEPKGILKE